MLRVEDNDSLVAHTDENFHIEDKKDLLEDEQDENSRDLDQFYEDPPDYQENPQKKRNREIKFSELNSESHARVDSLRHTFADFRKDPGKLKTKAILYIILSLIGMAYSMACFITSVQAYTAIGKNPLALSALIHNWVSTPIVDIKTIDDNTCSSGYTQMISRKWPGTKAGCNCNGNISIKEGN